MEIGFPGHLALSDLNPVEFYHLIIFTVYKTLANNIETLRQYIKFVKYIFEHIRKSIIRRIYACVETGGSDFEQCLQR